MERKPGWVRGESLLGEHDGTFSDEMLNEFEQAFLKEHMRQYPETKKSDNEIWFDGYKQGKKHGRDNWSSDCSDRDWFGTLIFGCFLAMMIPATILSLALMVYYPLQALGVL